MREHRADGTYLPYVDGLRAVAVLAVLAYHVDPRWLPGGFTGVDVFLVISGFVVSASVDRLERASASASAWRFWARRLRRIAPALVTCLLVTGVAAGLFIPAAWLSDTSQHTGRFAFIGGSNWVVAARGSDYFAPKAEFNPYTHTWSLGVEEQFYLLFPLLFLPWAQWGEGLRRGWKATLPFLIGFVASLAYAARMASTPGRELEAFYVTTTRFWELAAGVLLYQALVLTGLTAPEARRQRSAALSLGIGAAATLLVAGLIYARPGATPWPDALWVVAGTASLIGLVYVGPRDGWIARALSLASVVAIGRISYSLYLWHWPVLVLFRWTVGLDTALLDLTAVALAFVLAALSYRLVELPLRHSERLLSIPHRRFVLSAVAIVVSLGAVHEMTARLGPIYSLSVVTREASEWYPDGGTTDDAMPGCAVDETRVGPTTRLTRLGCEPRMAHTQRLFVAGDSHATAYLEMLRRVSLSTGRDVTVYAFPGCSADSDAALDCGRAVENAFAAAAADARSGDVLFLPRLRLPRLSEQWGAFDEHEVRASSSGAADDAERARGEAATVAALTPLARRGVRIVFEAPKPLFWSPAFRCSDPFNRGNPACERGLSVERAFLIDYRRPVMESLRRMATALPGATIWDPLPVLCPGAICTASHTGHPLFFDGDHVSGYGNRVLLPSFLAHVDALRASVSVDRS